MIPAQAFEPMLLAPVVVTVLAIIPLYRWLLPSQLGSLQVAFETQDDLYEVHRLTRGRRSARDLFSLPGVPFSMVAYVMAMAGILLLIGELIFDPSSFFEPLILVMFVLIGAPVLISPYETLNGQLTGRGREGRSRSGLRAILIRRVVTLTMLLGATVGVVILGLQFEGSLTPEWLAAGMLVFMAPTILAYGRIMGASWNMLVINKTRSMIGRRNPLDPDKLGIFGRLASFVILFTLVTMPVSAVNGIVTVFISLSGTLDPETQQEMLNFGGVIGYRLYILIEEAQGFVAQIEALKQLPIVLSFYLSMNIAVVGLAFIFELIRNLFIGGQTFGGFGGVLLASPREIRSEERAQGRILYFAFAGFSGYTVLLLLLVCYKEFGDNMPFTDLLQSQYQFDESMRLLAAWLFIGVGQAIFLIVWFLSIARFGPLRRLRFDLNPDERRQGAVMLGKGDWMHDSIDDAARNGDQDYLQRFIDHDLKGDEALVRFAKTRARMMLASMRGQWATARDEASNVLAQQGGDDDQARMITAVSYLATRRLDVMREAMVNMEQDEGYDEPELIMFLTEWLDPWHGRVNEDDLWDFENNPTIDHLRMIMQTLESWVPVEENLSLDRSVLTRRGQLSNVALLRARRRPEDGLKIALEQVKTAPLDPLPRIAVALCLLDQGKWHDALTIVDEVIETDPMDLRVRAVAEIFARNDATGDGIECELVRGDIDRRQIDAHPSNAFAPLHVKGGVDEAMTSNVLVTAHLGVEKAMMPRFQPSRWSLFLVFVLMPPTWIGLGTWIGLRTGNPLIGVGLALGLLVLEGFILRVRHGQRRVVQHRDQRAMMDYSRRMRRSGIDLTPEHIPVGNHLLLSGLLLTIDGMVLDIGAPAWLIERISKDRDMEAKERLHRASKRMRKADGARMSPLPSKWWTKRPNLSDDDRPYLERTLGPHAYRGRATVVKRKRSLLSRSADSEEYASVDVMDLDLGARGIAQGRMRGGGVTSTPGGPRRPGGGPQRPSSGPF